VIQDFTPVHINYDCLSIHDDLRIPDFNEWTLNVNFTNIYIYLSFCFINVMQDSTVCHSHKHSVKLKIVSLCFCLKPVHCTWSKDSTHKFRYDRTHFVK